MLQLDSHNRYPDCLFLNLTTAATDTPQQVDLGLTLHFNDRWQPLLAGRVKFGIKGGEIALDLDPSTIELSNLAEGAWPLADSPQTPVPILDIQPNSPDALTWNVEIQGSDPILRGRLDNIRLATLKLRSSPSYFRASFSTRPDRVYLTDAEGLWRHDINPNQHAILERLIANTLVNHYIQTDLSVTTLAGQSPQWSTAEPLAPALQALQTQIDSISTAKTLNFKELAALANLKPHKDFTGGNLRGTVLNGIDLSCANFAHVNLRGAELCDVDFSDSNLKGSKLSGADLSGAYLENTDLRYSDLHRASLALANLAEADLRGANLEETNLSQATLSYAQVEGARFGKNIGLSEEVKRSLQQRGAIFS
jgi:uncharacterized protein YjbI with pentapeptide repeats